jgi:hypothetical protein
MGLCFYYTWTWLKEGIQPEKKKYQTLFSVYISMVAAINNTISRKYILSHLPCDDLVFAALIFSMA